MKKICFTLFTSVVIFCPLSAQVFSPVSTTGYTLDAVAENTTALINTNGVLDGSNYVLYSAAYGNIYSIVGGIPNNGLISSGTYSYQLQAYNQGNVFFLLLGQTDSLTFTTPASYAALSLLSFATEGNAVLNATVRFTDNSTQVFSNLSLFDWFGGTSAVISGFGRADRNSGTITNPAGQPKMFNLDLVLTCANRLKLVKNIKINNVSSNARVCVMAVSGATMPSYNAVSTPVSCQGGTNGTASLSITNPLPPNSYTWSSIPNQFGATASNLISGVYSYTVKDAAGCSFSSTVAVGVSTVPLAPLMIGSPSTLVCPGTQITLSTFGANTYTWSNSLNSPITSVSPTVNSTYSVAGTTGANCIVTGSITINVYSVTPVIFTSLPASMCINAPVIPLTASPPGGTFSGQGIAFGSFNPSLAGAGTFTVSYLYTDANSCSSAVTLTTVVNPLPLIGFSVNPSGFCINASAITLSASPPGGVFSGTGVSGSLFTPSVAGTGSPIITYSFTDSNNCSNSAQVTLTVNPLPLISFTPIASAMCVNAAPVSLNASPAGGVFSGAGVINGSVFSPTVAGAGAHTISYSYTNTSTGCSAVKSVSTNVSLCTGLAQVSSVNTNHLEVYPNPANDVCFIRSSEAMDIEISDELGHAIARYTLDAQNNYQIKIEQLSSGLYFIMGASATGVTKQKLIIIR